MQNEHNEKEAATEAAALNDCFESSKDELIAQGFDRDKFQDCLN